MTRIETGNAGPPRFDAAVLLGSDIKDILDSYRGEEAVGLAIDAGAQRLEEILEEAVVLTGAESSSIMLMDVDREHLRVAAANGLAADAVAGVRRRVGKGIVGQAFATRNSVISRAQVPTSAEMSGLCRVAASVPIVMGGRSVGVLSVNVTSEEAVPNEDILLPLHHLARDLPLALLAAIDLDPLPAAAMHSALQCLTDRIMSLEEGLPVRLAAIAECLRKAVGAGGVRLYLLDSLGRECHEMAPLCRSATRSKGMRALDREFLAKVMRQGSPLVLAPGEEANPGRGTAISYLLRSSRPHSLMVFEDVLVEDGGQEEVIGTLQMVIGQLESMIDAEENLAVHELVSELELRITELELQLHRMPARERPQACLALGLDLTGAEVAIWIPNDGKHPLTTPCLTPEANNIQRWALGCLEALARWGRANGAEAQGAVARCWDPDAPEGPAPYVAVPEENGKGVLVVFFGSPELAESSRQVPSQWIWEGLRRLSSLIADGRKERAPARPEGEPAPPHDPHPVLAAAVFAEFLHHELMRARRYGHTFAMIRVQLAERGWKGARGSKILLEFLLRTIRHVDLIAEIGSGVFVLLPEPGTFLNVFLQRLNARWRSEQPDVELDAEQRNLSGADQPMVIFRAWVDAEDSCSEAA